MHQKINRWLEQLDRGKTDPNARRNLVKTLAQISRHRINEADALIHFHEILLFLRAYPPSPELLEQVETNLKTFAGRVDRLRQADVDLAPLDDPEVSGIAGTSVNSNFSYAIARWLSEAFTEIGIDWDWSEDEERFGATMPRFLPLLEEDAMVEAHVPYRDWVRAVVGSSRNIKRELVWLIRQFETLDLPQKSRAELYDALKLHITWNFRFRSSRTGMRLPVRKIFFHDQPLIQRRHVSLAQELNSPPIPLERLLPTAGQKIIDLARETSAVRYRELHGFTYGDARHVLKARLGRGVDVFVMGVPAEHRLPLRAYHAALIFKNGVPVAYFEGLSLFERMESGFNLYYTFRDGETAWLFGRILRLMRQLLGVTVISIDPYQIGHENEEGIESGAFWFYRKLGFRPVRPELMRLTLQEEKKIAAKSGYRTPAKVLRRLARGHMLFEVLSKSSRERLNWDRFEVRNLGFAVQKLMAREYSGQASELRKESSRRVAEILGLQLRRLDSSELNALQNFAPLLLLIPRFKSWSKEEKQLAARIIRAKARNQEATYLRLMQSHGRLRAGLVNLGSG